MMWGHGWDDGSLGYQLNAQLESAHRVAIQQRRYDAPSITLALNLIHAAPSMPEVSDEKAKELESLAIEWQGMVILSGSLRGARKTVRRVHFSAVFERMDFDPTLNGIAVIWMVPLPTVLVEEANMKLVNTLLPIHESLLRDILCRFYWHRLALSPRRYPFRFEPDLRMILNYCRLDFQGFRIENTLFRHRLFHLTQKCSYLVFLICACGGNVATDLDNNEDVTDVVYVDPTDVFNGSTQCFRTYCPAEKDPDFIPAEDYLGPIVRFPAERRMVNLEWVFKCLEKSDVLPAGDYPPAPPQDDAAEADDEEIEWLDG